MRGARSSVGEMVVFLRTSSTCSNGLKPDSSRTIFTAPFGTLIVMGVYPAIPYSFGCWFGDASQYTAACCGELSIFSL